MPRLADFCVYTMRHSSELAKDFDNGRRGELLEHKAWREGDRVLSQARNLGQRLPIVFSAAEADSGLIYSGLIDEIDIDDAGDKPRTRCRYSEMHAIEPARLKSELTLKSSGKALSDSYIRPYAVCRRPSFIN